MKEAHHLPRLLQLPMRPDQVIPAFGTVPEQAAFALGALPNFRHVMKNAPDYILVSAQVFPQI